MRRFAYYLYFELCLIYFYTQRITCINYLSALGVDDDCNDVYFQNFNHNCKSFLKNGHMNISYYDPTYRMFQIEVDNLIPEEINFKFYFQKYLSDQITAKMNKNVMSQSMLIPNIMHYVWLYPTEMPVQYLNNIIHNQQLMGDEWVSNIWVCDIEKIKDSYKNLAYSIKNNLKLKLIDDLLLSPDTVIMIDGYLKNKEFESASKILSLIILYYHGGNIVLPSIQYQDKTIHNYHKMFHTIMIYEEKKMNDYCLSTFPHNPHVRGIIRWVTNINDVRKTYYNNKITNFEIITSMITIKWLKMLLFSTDSYNHAIFSLNEIRFFKKI